MLLKHNMHSFLIKDIQTNKLHLNRQIQRDTQTLAADDVSFDSFKYIMPPFVFAAAQFRKTNAKCRWRRSKLRRSKDNPNECLVKFVCLWCG